MGKNFWMVVVGQVISLFGNAVLHFALPLHLLNVTNSPALFGMVSALAFLPMLVMSPIGGVVADRVNKKNIMAGLDFFTAGIVLVFTLCYGKYNMVLNILIVLTLLYGIAGAYHPAVQASVPALVREEKIVAANAVINMVSYLSGLLGPVIGGVCYSIGGLRPILTISIICFLCSAVMELFIRIPQVEKQQKRENAFQTLALDLKESIRFIGKEERNIGRLTILLALFNLFYSALVTIGIPVIVTQILPFKNADANQMLGYAQGILAFGGIAGGLVSAYLGEKLTIGGSWKQLLWACILLIPMALVLFLKASAEIAYMVICMSCFAGMLLASVFSIGMLAYVQKITPGNLIGKVIACVMVVCNCAQPVGQAMHGVLFEKLAGREWVIFLMSLAATGVITWKFYQWTAVYREGE